MTVEEQIKQDLEIYGNSYWYEGKRLDPTKFSIVVKEPRSLGKSVTWPKYLENLKGKIIRVEPKRTMSPHFVAQQFVLKDYDVDSVMCEDKDGKNVTIFFIRELASIQGEKKDDREEGGYLIEKFMPAGNSAMVALGIMEDGDWGWTAFDKALRFARKEDAEAVGKKAVGPANTWHWKAIYHSWGGF